MKLYYLFLVVFCLSQFSRVTFADPNAELRLYQRLIKYLDPSARPLINASRVIQVNVSVVLRKILHLADANQILVTNVWITEEWYDETLHWDPKRFGGIQSTTLDSDKIWCPDLYIFNNADVGDAGYLNISNAKVTINHDGRVSWRQPLMIKSLCAVGVAYFPFDCQRCEIRFASWAYGEQQLNVRLKEEEVDMSQYESNTEFHLSKVTAERQLVKYDLFESIHPSILVEVFIKRRPLYYIYTIIIPTLVLCLLTFFAFMLPADSAEKVGIGLTAFLSLYVLQSSVAENIAESSNVPLIVVFLTLVMTLISISLLFATLTINVKKFGDRHPVPVVPRYLLFFCSRYLVRVTCATLIKAETVYGICEGEHVESSKEIVGNERSIKIKKPSNSKETFLKRKSGESFRLQSNKLPLIFSLFYMDIF